MFYRWKSRERKVREEELEALVAGVAEEVDPSHGRLMAVRRDKLPRSGSLLLFPKETVATMVTGWK
jgi:hypothetical protein